MQQYAMANHIKAAGRHSTRSGVQAALQHAGICVMLLWAPVAFASLGGDIDSIVADQMALHGTLSVTAHLRYEVREIDTNAGARIREWVNPSGAVFAVAWSGPAMPNLASLLDDYYANVTHTLSQLERPGTHRSLRIETPELVIEITGHLRAYSGFALLTPLEPAGFTPTELR